MSFQLQNIYLLLFITYTVIKSLIHPFLYVSHPWFKPWLTWGSEAKFHAKAIKSFVIFDTGHKHTIQSSYVFNMLPVYRDLPDLFTTSSTPRWTNSLSRCSSALPDFPSFLLPWALIPLLGTCLPSDPEPRAAKPQVRREYTSPVHTTSTPLTHTHTTTLALPCPFTSLPPI